MRTVPACAFSIPSRQPAGGPRAAAGGARPARWSGAPRPGRHPSARAAAHRSDPARRRAAARLPARDLRRRPPGRGRLRHGAARPARGVWPGGLDHTRGRPLRARPRRARPRARAADHGPGAEAGGQALGARGGAEEPRDGGRPRRGGQARAEGEPPAAARRRGQGRDRPPAAPAGGAPCAQRRLHPLADRDRPRRRGRRPRPGVRRGALAGRARPLPGRAQRALADHVAQGGLA